MIIHCHECKKERECRFPFRPTRLCNDYGKFVTQNERDQYNEDIRSEKIAEIDGQLHI